MRHLDGFDIRFADMAARLERESVQQLPGRSTNRTMRLISIDAIEKVARS